MEELAVVLSATLLSHHVEIDASPTGDRREPFLKAEVAGGTVSRRRMFEALCRRLRSALTASNSR